MTTTFIYLIHNADEKAYKIGRSDNPIARLKQLQTGNARSLLRLVYTFAADQNVELDIHKDLEDYRLNGEWFNECYIVLAVFLEYMANSHKSNDISEQPNYCHFKNVKGTPTPSILTDINYLNCFNKFWSRVEYGKESYIVTTCTDIVLKDIMRSVLAEGWTFVHRQDVPKDIKLFNI